MRKDMETQNQTEINTSNESIGKLLSTAREGRGFSIKKVSNQTKISTTILEHLEEDNLEKLPNKAYVSGFVKSYAQVLGLNQDDCLKALDTTYIKKKSYIDAKRVDILKEQEEIEAANSSSHLYIVIGAIVVISVFIIFLNRDKGTVEKEVEVTTHSLSEQTPLQGSTDAQEVKQQTTLTESKADIKVETLPVKEIEAKKEVVKAVEPVTKTVTATTTTTPTTESATVTPPKVIVPEPVKKVEAKTATETKTTDEEEVKDGKEQKYKPLPGNLYAIASDPKSAELNLHVPENMQSAVVEGKQNVFISAVSGATWITYKKDDDPVKKFTLDEGKNILIRGDEIRVFLGNVNVTKVFLNNQLLSVPSRSGVKSLVFPQENSSKYYLPLFVYKKDGTVITSDEAMKETP